MRKQPMAVSLRLVCNRSFVTNPNPACLANINSGDNIMYGFLAMALRQSNITRWPTMRCAQKERFFAEAWGKVS